MSKALEPAPQLVHQPVAWWPVSVDRVAALIITAAFCLLYLPEYAELAQTLWATDEQGHGPIILVMSFWLLFTKRHQLATLPPRSAALAGWSLLVLSLLAYVLGRSQDIIMLSVGSQIGVLAALLLLFRGWAALRAAWFPLVFMLFMVPLPEALVATITAPLKNAVSAVAASLLYALGYPVGRNGVMLNVGQYQLLVADACAGLNSMFTLEALGMLYMYLMKYTNPARNAALAALLIPIAFCSNVVRVIILVLITYYFGDEAGQGFAHGLAGIVLFVVALILMLFVDRLLSLVFKPHRATHPIALEVVR